MIRLDTIRELLVHNDWARERLFVSASPLEDLALDRRFEMGEGSVRATLNHMWSAERVWLDRWLGHPAPRYRDSEADVSIPQLQEEFRAIAIERNNWLGRLSDDDLERVITYVNRKGQTWSYRLGDCLVHICNHGVYHRAQALNMLRHVGATLPRPGLDYVFMRLALAGTTAATFDLGTIRAYYAYADWARRTVHGIAVELSEEQLDRPFEMGLGSIRRNLVHIRDAEAWWLENWVGGPGKLFPEVDARMSISELTSRFDETAARRDAFLQGMNDADLQRTVSATPRPDVTRSFPLGVTLLQLCTHGTHHRAQAVNMFRHVGARVPAMDYLEMIDERSKTRA